VFVKIALDYLETIQSLIKEPSSEGLKKVAGSEGGQLGATRKKLIAFLEESQYYNPENILAKIPDGNRVGCLLFVFLFIVVC
jgi:hypothetical protein